VEVLREFSDKQSVKSPEASKSGVDLGRRSPRRHVALDRGVRKEALQKKGGAEGERTPEE
jgi:hypothetical protein